MRAYGGEAGAVSVPTAEGPVQVWGFAATAAGFSRGFNDDRDFPGPVFEFTQGQAATMALTNSSSALNHTIHPHGLDANMQNDGVPQTSSPVLPGASNTYQFVAPFAGTYFYRCHVDTALHVEMGMVGAIIVRPPSGAANRAWDDGPTFEKEYIWQLNTFDTRWHTAGTTGSGTLRYRPNVFMINGRDGAAPLTDPTTAISAPQGTKVLLRLISYGQMPAVVDLGGVPFEVIASDGRPFKQEAVTGQSTWLISPGERYDLLLTLPAAGVRQAIVTYLNIRSTGAVGSVETSITST